uniref:Putative secreted protein n=1 Tax=Anopheles darlingi TaxID=43151 RepID=A0A2M4DC90_ANODA
MMAWLAVMIVPPSSNTGIVCWGLTFENSSISLSPRTRVISFSFTVRPRARTVSFTARQGGLFWFVYNTNVAILRSSLHTPRSSDLH